MQTWQVLTPGKLSKLQWVQRMRCCFRAVLPSTSSGLSQECWLHPGSVRATLTIAAQSGHPSMPFLLNPNYTLYLSMSRPGSPGGCAPRINTNISYFFELSSLTNPLGVLILPTARPNV